DVEPVGEGGDLAGAAVGAEVLEHLDGVARLAGGRGGGGGLEGVRHPEPAEVVEGEGGGVVDGGGGGGEPGGEPGRQGGEACRGGARAGGGDQGRRALAEQVGGEGDEGGEERGGASEERTHRGLGGAKGRDEVEIGEGARGLKGGSSANEPTPRSPFVAPDLLQ